MRFGIWVLFLLPFTESLGQRTLQTQIDSIEQTITSTDPIEKAETIRKIGIQYKNLSQFSLALASYNRALELFNLEKDTLGMAKCYNNLGVVYWRQGSYDQALAAYLKSINYNEVLNNPAGLLGNYVNLGNFFSYKNEYIEALSYYQRALALSKKSNKVRTAIIEMNIGNIYATFKNINKNYDSAQYYYNRALQVFLDIKDTIQIAGLYNNLGLVAEGKSDYNQALYRYSQGLGLRKKIGDRQGIAISMLNIGNIHRRTGRYTQAQAKYIEGKTIAEEIGDHETNGSITENLTKVYILSGDKETALNYFEEYDVLKDSLNRETSERLIAQARTQYETEKKEQQIALQEAELQVQQANLNAEVAQKNGLMITLIVTACLVLVIVYFYQHRQKTLVSLRNKDRTLYNQQVDDLLKEGEINSLNALMEGQETERKRIAEDLHDRLGSMLAAVKLNYAALNPSSDQAGQLKKASGILDETINETRKIAHNLASGVLAKFGLVAALNDLKDKINGTQQITMEVLAHNLTSRYTTEMEVNLYRAVQELVSNVLKHAEASKITVQLTVPSTHALTIMVEDDGKGFDPTNITGHGMGLSNLEARVTKLDGTINIDSFPGRGTTTIIEIPTENHA